MIHFRLCELRRCEFRRCELMLAALLFVTLSGQAAAAAPVYAQTDAERTAGVVPKATQYPELDVRRYGAVCDYDAKSETDGTAPKRATDNLPALVIARNVIKAKGGGTMLIRGGGDCYLANGLDARGISNIYIYVEQGTTVRTTRYTRLGATITLGAQSADKPVQNIGVFGGGTLRNYRPDHAKLQPWKSGTTYAVGDYVLSTDRNKEPRAYYARTAGVSGATAPTVLNGNASDGGVSWQDADNDNVVGVSGTNVFLIGMNMPEASGKFATAQGLDGWRNVWFVNNRGGRTNDKGFEVKGQMGGSGQEQLFGDGAVIQGNVVESAGKEGIEAEQSNQGVNRNRNIRIIDNVVKEAGTTGASAGIRVNRADNVEVLGNQVLRSRGNCYHLRQSKNVTGNLDGADCDTFGAHLQELEGFSFDNITIKGAREAAVRETGGSGVSYVGDLKVEGARAAGWQTINRKGAPAVIGRYSIAGGGPQFVGRRPSLSGDGKAKGVKPLVAPRAAQARQAPLLRAFTLTLTNSGATVQQNIVDNASSRDGRTGPIRGIINPDDRSEFILDSWGAASGRDGAGTVVVSSDTASPVTARLARRAGGGGDAAERWVIQFQRPSDGSKLALDTTNIAAGKKITAQVVILPGGAANP